MATTSEPTHATSDLGKWVEDLYYRIFCHPDDEVSASAYDKGVAQGFTAKINHDQFSRQSFIDTITKFRVLNVTNILSTKDIQTWDAPDGSGAGCVAQYARFTDTNKETGDVTETTTLLVANIQVIDGQRVLSDLTEVLKVSK
ncbi:hypothetical protein BKA56DRAFT_589724 [Ilyonectria sp. MPI-CAGE-AT-0026]|nr:hypothetical protein BKA56DRAFT_589724 [Ilyonectria sp. MPI-CAGE-AT-0026]